MSLGTPENSAIQKLSIVIIIITVQYSVAKILSEARHVKVVLIVHDHYYTVPSLKDVTVRCIYFTTSSLNSTFTRIIRCSQVLNNNNNNNKSIILVSLLTFHQDCFWKETYCMYQNCTIVGSKKNKKNKNHYAYELYCGLKGRGHWRVDMGRLLEKTGVASFIYLFIFS